MFVLKRSDSGYAQCPTKYLDFSRFENKCGDFVLVEAAFEQSAQWEQFKLTTAELKKILEKKIVRLEFEEPNKFYIGDHTEIYDKYFYRIFTIDPYTAKWLNKMEKRDVRVPIYFPFNEDYIPQKSTKKYDIIYTGHIVSNKLLQDLKTLTKYKYRFVSNSKSSLVTNRGASYEEKIRLISESKITLVHNLQYPKIFHIFRLWLVKNYQKNEAFKLIPKWYEFWKLIFNKNILVPQIKSRLFEAAFSHSVILCRRDPFNVIERFFVPGKEFVYFEEGHLSEKIDEILSNYDYYSEIAENAYKKAISNYSTKAFVRDYLSKI